MFIVSVPFHAGGMECSHAPIRGCRDSRSSRHPERETGFLKTVMRESEENNIIIITVNIINSSLISIIILIIIIKRSGIIIIIIVFIIMQKFTSKEKLWYYNYTFIESVDSISRDERDFR